MFCSNACRYGTAARSLHWKGTQRQSLQSLPTPHPYLLVSAGLLWSSDSWAVGAPVCCAHAPAVKGHMQIFSLTHVQAYAKFCRVPLISLHPLPLTATPVRDYLSSEITV